MPGLLVPAQADDGFDSWQNTLAPMYLWGISVSGDATVGDQNVEIDIEFRDAVQDLSGIFSLHYEGARKNWGVIADYMFLNLTPEAETELGDVAVDFTNRLAEIDLLYRFGPKNPVQLLLGYRNLQIDIDVEAEDGTPLASQKKTINDVIFGGRWVNPFGDKWTFIGRVDYGNGGSDGVWNALMSVDYRFTKYISGFAGLRYLDYKIDKSSDTVASVYNVTYTGPVLALVIHW